MFKRMLALEDLFGLKEMEDFSLSHQKVSHFSSCRLSLRITIENHLKFVMCHRKMRIFVQNTFIIEATKKMPCDVQEFDYLFLTDMADYQQFRDDLHEIAEHRTTGKIHYIFGNLILFQLVYKSRRELKEKQQVAVSEDRPYHVEFLPNRIATRVAHRAVADAINNQLSKYLADFTIESSAQVKNDMRDKRPFKKFQWMNASIKGNNEQQSAIKNIINCTSFPSPYIIFGPPGTGKSTTLIEAIAQIVKLKPMCHILLTANSNAACDDLANRLLSYISINKVLRIYSPSFDKKPDKIDKNLEPISNFRNRHLCNCNKRSCPEIEPCDDPSYEEFYTSRVIIATLVSCGRIISAGIKTNHFDYIFIDEAASESEQYTLIPISGLASSLAKGITAQIVLSGDHKQLGAIIRDKFCRKLGMEKSLMERLMDTDPKYQRNPKYNQQFVTQLVQNYRSHAAILQFSNENFYDSQLVAKCPPEVANNACGWDFLLHNKSFPLLFHTTRTPSVEVGMSLKNEGEVNLLDNYVRVLLGFGINGQKVDQTDIGIISPYRAQRDRIIEEFHLEFPKIEIGTVDSFQVILRNINLNFSSFSKFLSRL
jgi:AAA domain